MNAKKLLFTSVLLGQAALLLSGCAKLMGDLRKDLDDSVAVQDNSPVVGGRWSERGFLEESMPEYGSGDGQYAAVGHSERSPAALGSGGLAEVNSGGSWVGGEQADQLRRDEQRQELISSSQSPVVGPPVKRVYKNGTRATRADFVDESQNEGSLWSPNGQTNFFFTKNKIRGVGDIVTVSVESDLIRDLGLEVRRTLTGREKELELAKAQERVRAKFLGLPDPDKPADANGKDAMTTTQAAPARPAAAAGANRKEEDKEKEKEKEEMVPLANFSDIDVSRSLEIKANDVMMGEIMERYPNGNYKIRATKKILYKNGYSRLVTLIGIARAQDISEEDVVLSSKLYEYRLQAVY